MQRQSPSANWIITAVTESSSINQPVVDGHYEARDALPLTSTLGATHKAARGAQQRSPHLSDRQGASPPRQTEITLNEAWAFEYHPSGFRAASDFPAAPLPGETVALGYEATGQTAFAGNLPYRLGKTEDPAPGAFGQTPFMTADLAILSAERYDDGVRSRSVRMTRKLSPTHNADSASAPRKRAKVQSRESADGSEEEGKRARGRPRLDTKDETPAERRRTQIRLAQRAYRSRKENAITTLEKKVQDLKDTNEEMSNAFLKLHDFALSQGLLDQIPEFGRQLQATTEKFLVLARKSSEDDVRDDDQTTSQTNGPDEPRRASDPAPAMREISKSPSLVDQMVPAVSKPMLPWGGYIISHEQAMEAQPGVEPALSDFAASLPATEPLDFEVVTQPTFENASFPLSLSAPGSPFQPFLEPSPYEGLSLPASYSPFETTFGRRLQRFAIEQAFKLVNMAHPDPTLFAKVFGFCMIFESIDKIKERLQSAMDKSNQESLNNWLVPFVNLGGAGTQFPSLTTSTTASGSASPRSEEMPDPLQAYPPLTGSPHHRMGNQGTLDPLRPKFDTGFSTGPFNELITEVRDTRLDKKLRILLPGFEGNFYDCDETEIYLHQRGVNIPVGVDTVTAEVDLAAFTDDTPDDALPSMGDADATARGLFGAGTRSGMPAAAGLGRFETPNTFTSRHVAGGDADLPAYLQANPFGNGHVASTATPEFDSNFLGFGALGDAGRPSTRMIVTINVNTLIRELVRRSTCLGRTPGFKQSDVNQAFWIATGVMASAAL